MIQQESVQLNLMQRPNNAQYFEVWVRSSADPRIRNGSIIERHAGEGKSIELLAGALAEGLCEKYGDDRDSCDVAKAAREAYREICLEKPVAVLCDEPPLR